MQNKDNDSDIYGVSCVYNTLFGPFMIRYKNNNITYIKPTDFSEIINKCNRNSLTDNTFKQLQEYFKGERIYFDLPLLMIGTSFQKTVWKELTHIKYGETKSYKQIAEAINNPKAARAIGLANNRNPINIIIPCHRVIGANGLLTGYAGGLILKSKLLDLEKRNMPTLSYL